MRDSKVQTLLIGGDARLRDAAADRDEGAPPASSERPSGRARRLRPHDHFWSYEPKASKRLLNTFLDTGKSTTRSTRRRRSTSRRRSRHTGARQGLRRHHVRPPALAAPLAAADVACAWQARPDRPQGERRCFGPCIPIVLGLGGWFAGVVIVLPAIPVVPLDDALLAVPRSECRSAWESTRLGRPRPGARGLGLRGRQSAAPSRVRGSGSRRGPGSWPCHDDRRSCPWRESAVLALDITRDRPMGEIAESAKGVLQAARA